MMRNGIFLGLALTLMPILTAQAADPMKDPPPPGYYAVQKVVYQNDSGVPDDHAYFSRLLGHIANHLDATEGKAQITVVSFAAGVKLFDMAKTDPKLAASIDTLRTRGVRFLICRNTMKGMGVTPADLYGVKPEDVVPSGVAEIARLQGLGFVYLHP